MTHRDELIRISRQSCTFSALTSCINILKMSVADTDYVLDIIDLLQERADDVEREIESILDGLLEVSE